MRLTSREVYVLEMYEEQQPHSSDPVWWDGLGWSPNELTETFPRVLVYDAENDKILINTDNRHLINYVMSRDPL